jgi:hypothetical protein
VVRGYNNVFDGTYINNGLIVLSLRDEEHGASHNQFVHTRFSTAATNFIIDPICGANQILFSLPLYALNLSDNYLGNNCIISRDQMKTGKMYVVDGILQVYGSGGSEIYQGSSNAYLQIVGGSQPDTGGRIKLYGESNGNPKQNVVEYTAINHSFSGDIIPANDDSYYLGETEDPYNSFKGIILKDEIDGKHYKITVVNGSLVATPLD